MQLDPLHLDTSMSGEEEIDFYLEANRSINDKNQSELEMYGINEDGKESNLEIQGSCEQIGSGINHGNSTIFF